MTVGEKLQEIMDWKGVKAGDVSRISGISRTMVGDYLRDFREPTLEALRKLAAALDVTPWMIINGEPMAVKDYELTEEERQLVGEYRNLSTPSRNLVKSTTHSLHEVERSLTAQG